MWDLRNIKNIKVQKKVVYWLLTVVIAGMISYSGWFLYINFYNTINWTEDVDSSLYNEAVIRHVDLKKMDEVVENIKKREEVSNGETFEIIINFQ